LKNDTWQEYNEDISSKRTFFKNFGSLRGRSVSIGNLRNHSEK